MTISTCLKENELHREALKGEIAEVTSPSLAKLLILYLTNTELSYSLLCYCRQRVHSYQAETIWRAISRLGMIVFTNSWQQRYPRCCFLY